MGGGTSVPPLRLFPVPRPARIERESPITSLRRRGAPHSGFSLLIRRISARSSRLILGLSPRRQDLQRQYSRKPRRCQRSTVSGFTMTMASNTDGNNRYNQTSIKRSMFRSRSRAGDLRFSTSSCWRKTRISASREERASITDRSASRKRTSNANIGRCSNTLAALRHSDEVLSSDRHLLTSGGKTTVEQLHRFHGGAAAKNFATSSLKSGSEGAVM